MPLDAATIRQLAMTSAGRRQLDELFAQGATSPLVRSGGMTALPPGTELLRPRPVLVGAATQATAPTEGFNVSRSAPPTDLPVVSENSGFMPESLTRSGELGGKSPISTQSGFMPESLTRPAEPAEAGGVGSDLWDRVKGFFDPDEPLTAEEQYDQDVSGAGWAGAAQGAAQAAQDYRSSPLQVLTAALGGYGVAKNRARGELKKEKRADEEFDLRRQALGLEVSSAQAKQAQQQLIMDEIGAIKDPEERRLAMLDPGAYATQRAKALFPDPEKLITVEGGGIFDPNSRTFIVPPRVKPTTPFGSDALGYFRLDENGVPQQLVGGLGREGKAPVPQYEISGGVRLNKFTGETELIPGGGDVPEIGDLQRYAASLPTGSPERAQVDKLIENKLRPPQGNEPPEIIQLQNIRDALKPDDPRRAEVQAVIEKLGKTGEGASIGTPSGAVPRLIELNQRVIDAGRNFGVLNPREQSEYRFLLAQEAAPKQTLDPGTGQTVTIPSDVSMFVKPPPLGEDVAADPTMAPISSPMELPAGAPGALPPGLPMAGDLGGLGGGTPGASLLPQPSGVPQLPAPGMPPQPPMAVGAPVSPSMGGPPPGVPMTSAVAPAPAQVPFNSPPVPTRVQGATKQQIEDYTKANKAVGTLKTATNRARELLKAQGGAPFVGAAASQMEVVINQIVTALGQQSDAGTMQPSDIDRYKGMVGDPTSLTGFLSNATGLRSFEAVISEMDSQAEQGMFKKAIDAGQSSIRTSDGRQVPVYTSDEAMNKALSTLKKGDRVITPDGRLMEVP